MFWKLNAEAFLGSSGIPNAIVKPCGLDATYGRGGKQLLVGHDDQLPHLGEISREDTAAVMLRPSLLAPPICASTSASATARPRRACPSCSTTRATSGK